MLNQSRSLGTLILDAGVIRQNPTSSGILSIPPEILSTIFEMGQRARNADPLYCDGGVGPAPEVAFELAVSHACLWLRNVALMTPRLWTTIRINPGSSVEWILELIRRSGACWLDLAIKLQVEISPSNDEEWDSMIDLVIAQSRRWRSLSVECNYETANKFTTARLCGSLAPGLQHLSLQVDDIERADVDAINLSTPHIFKQGTPKLKFVRLRGLAIHLFRPQLDAVVTLHLDHTLFLTLPYSTFRSIITCSSCLAHLSIHGDIINKTSWPGQTSTIHLPNLLSLRICGEGGEIYPGLLLGIKAPLLESLTLKDLQEHDLDPLWDLTDATRYSNLKHLVFSNFELSTLTYEHVARTFQEITIFSSSQSSITASPLIALLLQGTIKGQNATFVPWPSLAVLVFTLDDEVNDKKVIQKVANVRKAHGSALTRFLLKVEQEEIQVASENVGIEAEGVSVEYFYEAEPWPPNSLHVDHDDVLF